MTDVEEVLELLIEEIKSLRTVIRDNSAAVRELQVAYGVFDKKTEERLHEQDQKIERIRERQADLAQRFRGMAT